MRRRTALSLVFLLSLILTPRPAHAWLGWLDNLSGPGKFGGLLYEFRGVCFGPEMSYEVARQAIAARRQLKIVDVIPNRATGTSRAQAVLSDPQSISQGLQSLGVAIAGDRTYDNYYVAARYTVVLDNTPVVTCWGAFTQVQCQRLERHAEASQ